MERSVSLSPSPNWAPAFAGVVALAGVAVFLRLAYPSGASIDFGGSLNQRGPAPVM